MVWYNFLILQAPGLPVPLHTHPHPPAAQISPIPIEGTSLIYYYYTSLIECHKVFVVSIIYLLWLWKKSNFLVK